METNKGIFLAFLLFIIVISLATQVQATKIYGKIYGPDLELAEKAIVEINSTPKQNLVANDGSYIFIVNEGTYTIESFYSSSGVLLYEKQIITVPAEGEFVLDLILFESPDIEELEFDESELKMIEELLKEDREYGFLFIIAIIVIIGIIAFSIYHLLKHKLKKKIKKIKKKPKKKKKFKAKAIKEKSKPIGDEVMQETLKILKREKRVNQRDLRKELGISEAKASLVIADLESQGKVRKIKRGRGNIIIFEE